MSATFFDMSAKFERWGFVPVFHRGDPRADQTDRFVESKTDLRVGGACGKRGRQRSRQRSNLASCRAKTTNSLDGVNAPCSDAMIRLEWQ